MSENYDVTSEQTRQMKTTFVSYLVPFPGAYLQTPLLPSSSNSAFGKELGVAAVSLGVEQDCVTFVTPHPPCACETLATPVTSTSPGSAQGDPGTSAEAAQSHRAGLCPLQ